MKFDPRSRVPVCLHLKSVMINIGNTGSLVMWRIHDSPSREWVKVYSTTYLSMYMGPSWAPASWFHLPWMQVWMIRGQTLFRFTLSRRPSHVKCKRSTQQNTRPHTKNNIAGLCLRFSGQVRLRLNLSRRSLFKRNKNILLSV